MSTDYFSKSWILNFVVSFHQAQSSVLIGLRKLEKLGVPTKRPEDYFAEMVKTDDHMRRVREKLLGRQKVLEQKEKMRKMRELKKYGKKVRTRVEEKTFICLILLIILRFSMRFYRKEEQKRKPQWKL